MVCSSQAELTLSRNFAPFSQREFPDCHSLAATAQSTLATDIASFFAAIRVKNFHSFHTIGSYSTESKAKACGPMMREDNGTIVVPLLAEDVSITKQRVVAGSVEVSTVSRRHEHLVNELLTRESVEIERVPVGQVVKCAPQVREEGDTLIIPVMEEALVIERRLILKEEVR